MGVDYYLCVQCQETFPDCDEYTTCYSCEHDLCSNCMKYCLVKKDCYVCKKCANDDLTQEQCKIIAEFLIEQQTEFKSLNDVRIFLRQKGLINPSLVDIITKNTENDDDDDENNDEEPIDNPSDEEQEPADEEPPDEHTNNNDDDDTEPTTLDGNKNNKNNKNNKKIKLIHLY